MTKNIQITTVKETSLWKALFKKKTDDAHVLSGNILSLCDDAIDRMKAMYIYAPEYTLHDDRHLLRTTELMGIILGPSGIKQLNEVEISLLILSAFFHDQGMVPSKEEMANLRQNECYKLFRDNWLVEHPNYRETLVQMNSPNCAETRRCQLAEQLAELDTAILTDYFRETHGNRSAEFVCSSLGNDKRMVIQNINIASYLSLLCKSHTFPCEDLTLYNGFFYDEQVGTYTVNMPFLAVVLRLADILDFDRDRTPEVLLKNIHFTSKVSLCEWEKHRSVRGWSISTKLIRFTIKSKHPAYEAAARTYMDWIDRELIKSKEICQVQPRTIKGYKLSLPSYVDRSRIGPLNNAYHFHDLEFSLSRDEIVRLLMTDKLYGKEHLCIRELLQNSLDALRYRKALFSEAGISWEKGCVKFRHYINNDGYEVLDCEDNGSGMDDEIIQNHFVRIGRSYYRSPFFERERNRLKKSDNDFDPCSKFGIGFMSCFMLGDRITITTRRDYGYGKKIGHPLIVEIQGLSGLLVIRTGTEEQPIGTKVTIVSRQKPSFLDSWTDKIQLCRVLKGYALATEFPILGKCEIPEIHETINIPPHSEKTPTLLEVAQLQNSICLEQDLSIVSSNLSGFARESFLIDSAGLPCLSTFNAEWLGIEDGKTKQWCLYILPSKRRVVNSFRRYDVPVCADGILIAGTPGRPSYQEDVRRLGWHTSFIYSSSPSLIDVRGDLKPEITPGRMPPEHASLQLPPGWRHLSDTFNEGLGLLWEQLTEYLRKGLDPEIFWKLSTVHDISIGWIPLNTLWDVLPVSLTENGKLIKWHPVRELGELSLCQSGDSSFVLHDFNGHKVGPDENLDAWEKQGAEHPNLAWRMNSIVLLMCSLNLCDGQIILTPSLSIQERISLALYAHNSGHGVNMFLLDYVGDTKDAISVQTQYPTANRNHRLAKISHQSRYYKELTDLETFAHAFVPCIAETLSNRKNTPSLEKTNYWQKRVGHLYFTVQWDQYDSDLQPPYKVWTKEKGWFLFEEKDFAIWRDASVRL